MSEFAEGITETKENPKPSEADLDAAVKESEIAAETEAAPSEQLPSPPADHVETEQEKADREAGISHAPIETAPLTVNSHGQIWNPEVYATLPDGSPAVDSVGHYIKKELHYAPATSGWPGQS